VADNERASDEQLAADNVDFLRGEEVRTGIIMLPSGRVTSVEYAVVDDKAVFEGDIVLGTVDEVQQVTDILSQATAQGDDAGVILQGIGISAEKYRWPNALMPYEIAPNLPNQQRVHDAIAHWESETNMRFVQRTSANATQHPNFVRVIPATGCWSYVGMQGNGKQELGLSTGCPFGSVVHEFFHAWGAFHEQSREDRDNFVTIHWQNIQAGTEHNFNQHINDADDIGSYDYGSIMHYGRFAFSKNGLPTITPKQTGVTIGQRAGLSAGDIAAVHAMYRTMHHNLTVNQTYATTNTRNAWGHVGTLGWRRVHPDAPDGVTNVFAGLVWARAHDRKVHVLADGQFIYQAYVN
jgi:hypothetical protein